MEIVIFPNSKRPQIYFTNIYFGSYDSNHRHALLELKLDELNPLKSAFNNNQEKNIKLHSNIESRNGKNGEKKQKRTNTIRHTELDKQVSYKIKVNHKKRKQMCKVQCINSSRR